MKNKKIAIPLENGVLSQHFGHCQTFAIVNVENDTITEIKEIVPPDHVPGLYPKWIAQIGVTDVIAGGMGQKAIELFNQQKINVFVGAPVKTAEELVIDFLNNNLNLNANYCDH
ncbi:MAG: NifB/NifX family molybdenum-iron cluster-binding protein [Bacteroidales bacterium]|nr:NifB/NifX family molybdenum-iron cluster-binding protein [Bacteroidales bacterium]